MSDKIICKRCGGYGEIYISGINGEEQERPCPDCGEGIPQFPSSDERIAELEAENARLRAACQMVISGLGWLYESDDQDEPIIWSPDAYGDFERAVKAALSGEERE